MVTGKLSPLYILLTSAQSIKSGPCETLGGLHRSCVVFFKYIFIGFREEKRGKETSVMRIIGCLLHAPFLGTEPTTWACTLDQNRIQDSSVCRLTLYPLSQTARAIGVF
ncbi:unnamed protein product [Pipistrellus nathusii]|uniref:Secreted protein n=1 Tax=Pipistrellus nathusii TaxID=59473 RepID=A0ABN9ZNB2_PIPNA